MIVSLIVLVLLIVKVKINPIYSLVIVALCSAVAFGFPIKQVIGLVTGGFGGTIGNIGIVIILGTTIGEILKQTGGAVVLANTILKWVGKKHTSLAMAISGYLVGIPVFSDSAIVILSPVANAMSSQSQVPLFGVLGALNAGILATHCMVPPTPGPLAAAGTLNADLGLVIVAGLICSIPYTIAGTLWCNSKRMLKEYPEPSHMLDNPESTEQKDVTSEDYLLKTDKKKMPNAALSFACVLVPVCLICLHSFTSMAVGPDAPILTFTGFIGHPVIALFIGVILCLFLDTSKLHIKTVGKWLDDACETSGFIILATGAAGAYGAVLKSSGVGTLLGTMISSAHVPGIFVPFLVSLLLSVSNGSATVSLLTGSAIMLPLVPSLGISPVMCTVSIGAAAAFFYHANGSHFWVVNRQNKLTVPETFKLCSYATALASIATLPFLWILSLFF